MHVAHAFFASPYAVAGTATAVCPAANLVAHVAAVFYMTLDIWVICRHTHSAHHTHSTHHTLHHYVGVHNHRRLDHLRLLHHGLLHHAGLLHHRLLHHWLLHHRLLYHWLLHHRLLHHWLLHHWLLHLNLGYLIHLLLLPSIIDGEALGNQGLLITCTCHLSRFDHLEVFCLKKFF